MEVISQQYFYHERSTRLQALLMLVIALGAPLMMWFMLNIVAGGKVPPENEKWIYLGTFFVSALLVVVFVIPDFRRNSIFIFEVTDQYVKCDCPGERNYMLPLDSIEKLTQVKKSTGSGWVDELIETKDGKFYSIPKRYHLHVGKAVKAIEQANPKINRNNEVSY